jgi:uncharacterized protein
VIRGRHHTLGRVAAASAPLLRGGENEDAGQARRTGYARLARLSIRHTFYNASEGRCPDFAAQPTGATAALMRSLGMLFKPEADGFSVLYDRLQERRLLDYLAARRDAWTRQNASGTAAADGGAWTRLSFLLSLRNPYFVNQTELPMDLNPATRNVYLSNREAHVRADGTVLLNRGARVRARDLEPVTAGQLVQPVTAAVERVRVLALSGEEVLSVPRCVTETVTRDGKEVEVTRGCTDRLFLDFDTLPEDLYTVQEVFAGGGTAEVGRWLYTGLSPIPLCFVDLFFSDPEGGAGPGVYPVTLPAPGQAGGSVATVDYTLRFVRRSTWWSYYVMPQDPAGALHDLRIEQLPGRGAGRAGGGVPGPVRGAAARRAAGLAPSLLPPAPAGAALHAEPAPVRPHRPHDPPRRPGGPAPRGVAPAGAAPGPPGRRGAGAVEPGGPRAGRPLPRAAAPAARPRAVLARPAGRLLGRVRPGLSPYAPHPSKPRTAPMPATRTYTTPGVYVAEKSAFPPSVVGVKTAVPAFIGYTEKAQVGGKPSEFIPVPISSMAEFEETFGREHRPLYFIKDAGADPKPDQYDFRVRQDDGSYKYYKLDISKDHGFNLYNSMRLFYANGGGECFVVSVGAYVQDVGGKPTPSTISPDALKKGLAAVQDQDGPTMLVIPDAVLLAPGTDPQKPWVSTEYGDVVTAMLEQCELLQDRVAVIDVYGSQYLVPPNVQQYKLADVVRSFSEEVGGKGLSYGMAYFPQLQTTVVPASQIQYSNLYDTDADLTELKTVLKQEVKNLYGTTGRAVDLDATIDKLAATNTADDVKTYNDQLTAAIPLLGEMEAMVAQIESILPASAAAAGVMAYVDRTAGVWSAPANVTLAQVIKPMVPINDAQQGDLNVPVNGKAIDVVRQFPGRGTLIWGARTLDGNSNDYRYIQVRRTLIYIEQSIKTALNQFVFAPNNGQTWTTVVATISGFLQGVWSQGGLMGATASEAFTVECGLGSTMTGNDILEGYMLVQVTLQLLRPAEFIELTFKQTMEGVA